MSALAWTSECANAPLGSLAALRQSLATADGVELAEKLVLLLSNAIPALHASDDPQNPFVLLLTSRLENYRKLWGEALLASVDDDAWRYLLRHAGGTQCTQLSLLFSDVYSRTASLSAAGALKLARYTLHTTQHVSPHSHQLYILNQLLDSYSYEYLYLLQYCTLFTDYFHVLYTALYYECRIQLELVMSSFAELHSILSGSGSGLAKRGSVDSNAQWAAGGAHPATEMAHIGGAPRLTWTLTADNICSSLNPPATDASHESSARHASGASKRRLESVSSALDEQLQPESSERFWVALISSLLVLHRALADPAAKHSLLTLLRQKYAYSYTSTRGLYCSVPINIAVMGASRLCILYSSVL